ncbi:MAG TPA: phosphogluconate dehydrogenase (NADP(+)-dependent, decarboxylating) [Sphingobacteriaceae bacterium]|nr:phosphogluconate dehydrogenase (NADP(+)-dependent, decarboxylating) [Sphingobacteriaceae bacterium]
MNRKDKKYTIGMIGLGTMGCNLLLNIADHGFSGAGYDKNADQVATLNKFANDNLKGFNDITNFIQSLVRPRILLMLVPAGKIVDDVIAELMPLIEKGDIIIDGGNSHFTDTEARSVALKEKGLHFFGMGISGGEEGARYGPSMMPGGDKEAYKHVKYIFEAIAAKADGYPCVTYIGPGASGHFVKMVHNGIEYALMQLIAETYEILRKGLGLNNPAIHNVFQQWNQGRLQSYLMEITADIFILKKAGTPHLLLDDIKDEAKAKGTGKWTSQNAMDLELPIPVIDTAVSMRDLSKYKSLRKQIAGIYSETQQKKLSTLKTDEYLIVLEKAFYFCLISTYGQGMHLLHKASQVYGYKLELDQIAKIWRGGCIIRSKFLEDIYSAFRNNSDLEHLLVDQTIQSVVKETLPGVRTVVSDATAYGLAVSAYAGSLNYFENLRSESMPSNLIQAQRDFFGAHTYELIGKQGVFHTDWIAELKEKATA